MRDFRRQRFAYRTWLAWGLPILFGWLLFHDSPQPFPADRSYIRNGSFEVLDVCDDGTIVVAGHIASGQPSSLPIQFLGIELLDRDAAVTTLRKWISGRVRLRFDRRRVSEEGCLIAYVYAGDLFVNAELLRNGWARETTHPSDAGPILRRLKEAERDARDRKIGVWRRG